MKSSNFKEKQSNSKTITTLYCPERLITCTPSIEMKKIKETQSKSENTPTLYCPEILIICSPSVKMKTIINYPLIVSSTSLLSPYLDIEFEGP